MADNSPTLDAGLPEDHTGHTEAMRGFVAPTASELDAVLPQFDVLQLLGQGGMGAVYQARQRTLNRLVAIKILAAGEADSHFAARFTREAHALARLSHPHIVTVHDAGQTDTGIYYLVMEYVDGTDLRQVLGGASLPPEKALAIVPAICDALIYAHQQGIVHRDIKPENILLDRDGRVKIADFGLAKLVGSHITELPLTATRQIVGTPYYMAPEQARHGHKVDHRADIYALGVVFYEMLTGDLPRGHFPPPSAKVPVDQRLDAIVMRSMASDPEQRYQQVGELKTDIERVSSGEGHAVPPIPSPGDPVDPADAPAHRRVSVMAAAGAIWGLPFYLASGLGIHGLKFVGFVGGIAPVGATLLGILAVRAIRRSGGRLAGMTPAAGAALVVPLVALDQILWALAEWIGLARFPMMRQMSILPLVLLNGWLVFRLAARLGRPAPPGDPATPGRPGRCSAGQ